MEMGSNSLGVSCASGSSDSLNGLKFVKKIYFEDVGNAQISTSSSSSSSSAAATATAAPGTRKGRGAAHGGGQQQQQQPPRCQVEGCGEDLSGEKAYYCRHKVCTMHSKSPKVIVGGREQRFCQQCSRFHQLPEFDQGKRSCRRRLAGHNERRRKPPPMSLSSRYGQFASSFHDNGSRSRSFLMDFAHPRLPSSTRHIWSTTQSNDQVSVAQWPVAMGAPPPSRDVAQAVQAYSQGPSTGILFPHQDIPPDDCLGVPSSSCALSLLSTQAWGATATSSRATMMSANNFECNSMAQSSMPTDFLDNNWGFRGHETSESLHEVPPMGQAAEPVSGQFPGELELALQGNRQCTRSHAREAVGPSGNQMHWSL